MVPNEDTEAELHRRFSIEIVSDDDEDYIQICEHVLRSSEADPSCDAEQPRKGDDRPQHAERMDLETS